MWNYRDLKVENITDFPDNTYGFVYEVIHIPSGKKYIGKKVLFFNRTLPPLKGTKKKRKVIKESDWLTYYGSHPEIKKLLKTEKVETFTRNILYLAYTKKQLTYYEIKYLCISGAIEPNSGYINDNISGKFFTKDFYNDNSK
jgi:hypothetical protein